MRRRYTGSVVRCRFAARRNQARFSALWAPVRRWRAASSESHRSPSTPAGGPPRRCASATTGRSLDELSFQAMGAAAAWMVIEPPSISLPPGGEAAATIRFNPPRSPEVLPGETPFAVQVVSREDPDGSVAGEGTIVVGRYDQRLITLTPPRQRRAAHRQVRGHRSTTAATSRSASRSPARTPNTPAGSSSTRPIVDVGPGTARAVGLKVVAPASGGAAAHPPVPGAGDRGRAARRTSSPATLHPGGVAARLAAAHPARRRPGDRARRRRLVRADQAGGGGHGQARPSPGRWRR